MTVNAKAIAESMLEHMQAAGFDASRVSASISEQDELNVAHNEPSLLRSTENYNLSLAGILDGRKATTTFTDISDVAIKKAINDLRTNVESAPKDDANAFSANQVEHFEQGPVESDRELLAEKALEILQFRSDEVPSVMIEELAVTHRLSRSHELTSLGTNLSCVIGSYELGGMCIASENGKTSSLNYSGGQTNDLRGKPAADWFALGEMMKATQRQITTRALGPRFKGDVILAPTAVSDLVGWLLDQLSSQALISGSSVYRHSVGEQIAASTLNLSSRFDAPGHVPFTADGFRASPIDLIEGGQLTTLLPDLYGSRKTGIPHRPSTSGWQIEPGTERKEDLIAGVGQGALVTRFSMGSPAANGDFSGIIKNSFIIEDGEIGAALAEAMVAGNMARMLLDINGISAEHVDYGGEDFPWIRIPNLHFS